MPASSREKDSVHERLILHSSFRNTLEALRNARIELPESTVNLDLTHDPPPDPSSQGTLAKIEEGGPFELHAVSGEGLAGRNLVCAYDESVKSFAALEGTAFLTSHSLVVATPARWLPLNLMTLYFYTRSLRLQEVSEFIRQTQEPERQSKADYQKDRLAFLLEFTPRNSILLIDGPIIAGDEYTVFSDKIARFHEKDILPVFLVKNSESDLVINNTPEIKGQFNSDLHWANSILLPGNRTAFYRYTDSIRSKNSKVFAYLRSTKAGPTRVEFSVETVSRFGSLLSGLLDLLHYLILVQGDTRNPQARPIAIAERFARETQKLIDLERVMRWAQLHPTMNQERFAW